ncbi:hypothetical protein NBRC116599_29360 [Aquicoccus sp. SU-CL01552]
MRTDVASWYVSGGFSYNLVPPVGDVAARNSGAGAARKGTGRFQGGIEGLAENFGLAVRQMPVMVSKIEGG